MNEGAKKAHPMVKWMIGSVILIFLILGLSIFRDHINTLLHHGNDSYCKRVEADAYNISAAIADYFAFPEHDTLPTINASSEYLGMHLNSEYGKNPNIAWVTGDPLSTITIVVQDGSGKCPDNYQAQFPEWNSGRYILKMEY